MDFHSNELVNFARQLSSSGCFNKAYDLYISAFEKEPSLKADFEPEFRTTLTRLNEALLQGNKMEDIFCNFGRATNLFPDNPHLLNDIGKYLFKYRFYNEAWGHFEKVLKMDSGFVNAERNLNSVKNLLVERWHFRMLNDKTRNLAYRKAIKKTVTMKESVLDIGTGTGLLALYASDCRPIATTGVESSEAMAELAELVVAENKTEEIVIVNKMSTECSFWDIGGKRSVLITELFDAGLLGEEVLQTLAHAHEHLMTPKVTKTIPNKAEFFIIGAKCDHLNMKYQLCSSIKKILKICGLNVHIISLGETYDCEDVHLYKDLKYLTEPQSVLKVDFNSINDIQEKLKSTEPIKVSLKAIENGKINAIIGYFTLQLNDTISITTDPQSEARSNAWQQALFFDTIPQTVDKNQAMDIEFLINGGQLTTVPSGVAIHRISPETLRFLNDTVYVSMIRKCLGMVSVYLGQLTEMCQINIVDLCPFPLFGLLMLKRGAQSVTCCAKTEDDKKFFEKVLESNKIDVSRANILIGDDWTQDIFGDEKYYAIFCNIFDLCGDIDMRMKQISHHLKNAHLIRGGLFMPANITLMGQVISSHWLDINNRLYDENVTKYKMAEFVNKFQVSQNYSIDFSCLEYTALSLPVNLGVYYNGLISDVINVPIIESGDANAIICWYNIEMMEEMGEIISNRGNSFIEGVAFLANPPVPVVQGAEANILLCVDADGAFKLMLDFEVA